MRTLAFVGALVVGALGCKGGSGDKFDEILTQLEKFKVEMCACKDAACASKVADERREYKRTMRDKLDKGAKPSPEQDRKGKAIEAELAACRKALLEPAGNTGSATTDPE